MSWSGGLLRRCATLFTSLCWRSGERSAGLDHGVKVVHSQQSVRSLRLLTGASYMSPRTRLLDRLAELTNGGIRVIDKRAGWPGVVELIAASKTAHVSLHVGLVGLSGRGRDHVERRYQNPVRCDPVIALPGTMPMLLGLWTQETNPVLVAHDALRRLGHGGARNSLFVGLTALRAAAANGWAEYVSDTGERIMAFRPEVFPVYAEMFIRGVLLEPVTMASLFLSADLNVDEPASVERVRRATSALARSARFRIEVVAAYNGCCAMCGLGLGLVEGAHIYPASAPSSSDDVRNGLALCPNHHAAFDRYLLCIQPSTHQILLHPSLTAAAATLPAAAAFVSSTSRMLIAPRNAQDRASDRMIKARNSYFEDAYSWVGA
jgi:hypothetical protein